MSYSYIYTTILSNDDGDDDNDDNDDDDLKEKGETIICGERSELYRGPCIRVKLHD